MSPESLPGKIAKRRETIVSNSPMTRVARSQSGWITGSAETAITTTRRDCKDEDDGDDDETTRRIALRSQSDRPRDLRTRDDVPHDRDSNREPKTMRVRSHLKCNLNRSARFAGCLRTAGGSGGVGRSRRQRAALLVAASGNASRSFRPHARTGRGNIRPRSARNFPRVPKTFPTTRHRALSTAESQ